MVGGHTITKPTINLSRVNMESISRLSEIQEVITPDRNEEISENRPSLTVSLPSTPLRYVCIYLLSLFYILISLFSYKHIYTLYKFYINNMQLFQENNRTTCRMPERLISSPRVNGMTKY